MAPRARKPTVATIPALVRQWHPTKNGDLGPDLVTAGSSRKVWWRCAKRHVWEAPVGRRARGSGCPLCSGQRTTPARSLARRHPALAREWHETRNAPLQPTEVGPSSKKVVWWRCGSDPKHEWQAAIARRTKGGKCPLCTPKRGATLAERCPEVAAQWHPTRNGSVTPHDVTAGADARAWWICPTDPRHVWAAFIGHRAKGVGCPFCSGRRHTPERSLAAHQPSLAKEWHPKKNGRLRADEVGPHSERRVWWRCRRDKRHEWQQQVFKRTQGSGCPYCAHKRVHPTTSLAALHPDLAAQWHAARNGTLRPDDVVPGSERKVWWRCVRDGDHVWQARVTERARGGHGCPYCTGRLVMPKTSLARLHPQLAREWHPTRNGTLRPTDVRPGSNKKVWWQCRKDPRHVWQAVVASRALKGNGCVQCRSLDAVRPDLARHWHHERNGRLTPTNVTASSERVVWWRCPDVADHEWRATVVSRTLSRTGARCPLCISLEATHPELAREWHPTRNAPLGPHQVTSGSSRKVWWRCAFNKYHIWQATISNRTRRGTIGCSECGRARRRRRKKRPRLKVPILL